MVKLKLIKVSFARIHLVLDKSHAAKIGACKTVTDSVYWVPKTCRTLEKIVDYYGGEDEASEEILDLLYELRAEAELAEISFREVYHPSLRYYQNDGITHIRRKGTFGLFWDPRVGKTPTSVISIDNRDKVVIAVPSGLSLTWKKEFETWSKRKDVYVLAKNVKKRVKQYQKFKTSKRMVLIGSTKTLVNDVPYQYTKGTGQKKEYIKNEGMWDIVDYDTLILDEAHFLRNYKTKQSKGAKALRAYAKNVITLTGTPATNGAEDVLHLLDFLHPFQYAYGPLVTYFFNVTQTRYAREIHKVKAEKYDEWVEMLSKVSQQIKIEDVLAWLPNVTETNIYLYMESKQSKYYEEMIEDYRLTDDWDDVTQRVSNKLTQLGSLIRIGLDPRILDMKGTGAKTLWLKEYFKEHKDKPTIIVSPSTSYLNLLNKEIFKGKASMITGEFTSDEKTKQAKNFQEGKTNVIMLNTVAGSTGWTLDRANTTIFTNQDWNPTNNIQISKRMMPVKEENNRGDKEIIYLRVERDGKEEGAMSMDDFVAYALENKLDKTEIVNNYTKWLKGNNG